jgi:hypothetical protein
VIQQSEHEYVGECQDVHCSIHLTASSNGQHIARYPYGYILDDYWSKILELNVGSSLGVLARSYGQHIALEQIPETKDKMYGVLRAEAKKGGTVRKSVTVNI